MIALFRHLLRLDPTRDAAGADEALAFLGTPPAPMSDVRPPEASNDDLMRAVYDEVARELRVAGYLR